MGLPVSHGRIGEPELAALTGRLYEAALEPALWDEILADITAAFHANGLGLFIANGDDGTVGLLRTIGVPLPEQIAYRDHYAKVNVWVREAQRTRPPVGVPLLSQEFYPEADLLRSEFYNDYLRALDFHYHCGGPMRYDGPDMSVFNVLRSRRQRPFDEQDRAACQILMPHILRAVQLHGRLESLQRARDDLLAVLDLLHWGVVLLDARGRVAHLNQKARAIEARRDGLTVDGAGRLRATKAEDSTRLARACAAAVATGSGRGAASGGAVAVSRPSGKRAYGLLATPLRAHPFDLGDVELAAVVFVTDPEERQETLPALLQRLYGLTVMEARLASALGAGDSLKAAADALGITHWTARDYLKGVFRKTGSNRQADLVRLLLSGPAALGARDPERHPPKRG